MHHGQRQHPCRVMPQIGQVHRHQQQTLRHQRRKQRQHAQVPNLPGVQPRNARRSLRQKQRQQNAHRGQRAIRRNQYCADVEENWMHLSKNKAFASQALRAKKLGREVESDPRGRG